jgi:hypothetical protein
LAAAAPLGMPSGKNGHHPGWKPLQGSASDRIPGWAPSPCRLPGPVTRYETCLRRVLTAATVSSTPFRAPVKVCGARCAGEFSGKVLGVSFLVLSSWVCLVLSWVLSSFLGSWCAVGRQKRCAGQRAWCAGEFFWGQFLGSLVLSSWFLGVHGSWVCLVLSWVLSSFLGSWWWWWWWRWRW